MYDYRIRAVNAAGNSAWSDEIRVNTANIGGGGGGGGGTPTPTAPAAAGNLSAVVLSTTRVRLAWTDNSANETGFKVQRRAQGQTAWATLTTTAANVVAYDDAAAAANTTYEYRVIATNAVGDAAASNVATATTAASGIPAAPANLLGALQTGGSVRLTWADNSSNESGFQVERRFAGWIWEVIGTAAANVLYEYRVAAASAAGLSPYSNGALVNTGAGTNAQTFATQAAVLTTSRTDASALPAEPTNAGTFSQRPIEMVDLV
jgi:hypothetical protein